MKYLLTLAFVGTGYSGWQSQKNSLSVQSVLTDACRQVFGGDVLVTGCSRTDAGVHAKGFCCALSLPEGKLFPDTLPAEKIPFALNRHLPDDIGVISARTVPDYFHPRYSAVGKTYEYVFLASELRNPFYTDRAYWIKRKIDPDSLVRMKTASSFFEGTHDFSAYMSSGSSVADTVRTVMSADVISRGDTVVFTVTADGFLYNMVRIMAGTLLEVAKGRINPDDIPSITGSRDRSLAGPTAPACGLYLVKAHYKPDWSLNEKNYRN